MNSSAPGLGGAPVTKGALVLVGASSLLLQSAGGPPRALARGARALGLRTPAELIFGAGLLYHGRSLERALGPAQYGTWVAATLGGGAALEAGVRAVTGGRGGAPAALRLAFANLVPFFLDTPPTASFTLMGIGLTDKSFVYAAAAQLLAAAGRRAVLGAACSLVAGALVRADVLGIGRLRLPSAVQSALGRVLGPLLGGKHKSRVVVPASGGDGGLAPRPSAGAWAAAPPVEPSPQAVQQLVSMGFDAERSRNALRQVGGDVQAALGLLLG